MTPRALILGALLFAAVDVLLGLTAGARPDGLLEHVRLIVVAGTWTLAAAVLAGPCLLLRRAVAGRRALAALVAAVATAPLAWRAATTLLEGPRVVRVLAERCGDGADFVHMALRVAAGLGVAAAAAFYGAHAARPSTRARRVAGGATTAAAALAAHVLVLPGNYPAFHEILTTLAFAGCVELGAGLAGTARGGGLLAASVFTLGLPGAWWWATEPEARATVTRGLPLLRVALDRVAPHFPPPGRAGAAVVARLTPWSDAVLEESLRRLRADGLPKRPSFLLLTIDAVRADKVGALGGEKGYTPRLDALAAAGWGFTRAYAPASITFQTVSALMRGLLPDRVALLPDPDAVPRLAERMDALGRRTYAAFPREAVFFGKQIGKDFSRGDLAFSEVDGENRPDAERIEHLFEFLDRDTTKPFCAWVHLMGPHAPYTPEGGPRFGLKPSQLYAAEVAEADRRIGDVIDRVRAAPYGGSTVIVVASDHGEAFGERGTYFHGLTVYDEEVRVPLIVAGPGIKPARVDGAVSLIDLLPTFLHLAGASADPDSDGRSLAPLATGLADGSDRAAVVVHRHPRAGAAWKAAVRPPWKLMKNERTGVVEVFDLAADPGEKRPVPRPATAAVDELFAILESPPAPPAASRGDVAARRAAVARAALALKADDPLWETFLVDPSSVVRVAAVDALEAAGGAADEILRRFALGPGTATDSERMRALTIVNARPRAEDLSSPHDAVRLAVATSLARLKEDPPYDLLRERLAVEANPNVLFELLTALDRAQQRADERIFERHAAREDYAGARAAAILAMRRLGEAGLKRPGARIVDRSDVVVATPDETSAVVEAPALTAEEARRPAPLWWVVFSVPGRDGKELEAFVTRKGARHPFRSHVLFSGCLIAVRQTTEPLKIQVVGVARRPEFVCALRVDAPGADAAPTSR